MNAAVLESFGKAPKYQQFADPVAGDGEVLLQVAAASLKPLDKWIAAGSHYSSSSLKLPAVCGTDGVGRLPDGTRVFFAMPRAPFGTMAERTVVRAKQFLPLPEGLNDVTAAAIFNPGLAAWTSLAWRAQLQPGEHVLILGATGIAGRLAIQAAKSQGAGRVIAAGREPDILKTLPGFGADAVVSLALPRPQLVEAFAAAAGDHGYDVVLDFVWGAPTEALLESMTRSDLHAAKARTRLVEIGESAGPTITLPAAALRSTMLEITGAGTGSAPPIEQWIDAFHQLVARAIKGEASIDTLAVPLADVESAWNRRTPGKRIVLIP